MKATSLLSSRAKALEPEAWEWLEDTESPYLGVLQQLHAWRDDGSVSALEARPVVTASTATRAAFEKTLAKLVKVEGLGSSTSNYSKH